MDCDCRKPRPGMLLKAAEDLGIDLSTSIMFGDKPGDMTAGRAAGCVERIQLGTDGLEAPVPSADATGAFRSLADAVASPGSHNSSKGVSREHPSTRPCL